ncbi:bifunctional DNA primase/polymerase [Enterococcus casseliflavus]|uniref:bifunctional DNA primase/polymerase n=1 Tax=Enterococcus casseliflavus TaxID=37734 RepID=UPI00295449DC|nr:bifunctional DNA primase/polymerase [Enterococcus casseliflavus]MDV7751732.1 bifunctional DNA primase/polymerase [Enterococcus casseliflavus]
MVINTQAALKLQKDGFYIYPLAPNTKIPLKGSNGFNDATNDLETIQKWWNDEPNRNIGLMLKQHNLIVIDCDNHIDDVNGIENFKQIAAKYNGLDTLDTYRQITPRNGIHFIFKLPIGVDIEQQQSAFSDVLGNEKTGIDIIRYGVPLAPTITPKGQYKAVGELTDIAMLPQWIVDLLVKDKPVYTTNYGTQTGKKYTGKFLDELVQGCTGGSRNDWIMKQISKMLAVGADLKTIYALILVINQNFLDEPLPEKEINATFKSRVKKHTRGRD